MQEFSSISVSSYDAGALAERLTEQSKDGWSVVSIVPTGSTVTAYLSRDAGTAGAVTATPGAGHATPDSTESDSTESASTESDSTAPEGTSDDSSGDTAGDSDDRDAASTPDSVTEAPGWAAGGDTAASTHPMPAAASSPSTPSTPAAPSTPAEPAAAAATPAAGAAPAGWYADPSSRFELRYWDGGQWTEHVSRAGQQYTDPPVA